jgi:tRNA-dihydrouridine synthase 2
MESEINNQIDNMLSHLKNKVILAPMVRINTTPFRILSLKYGADLIFTEEIIAKKLRFCEKVYNPDLKTNDYLSTKEGTLVLRVDPISEKHKLILQIGASNPDDALQAALILKDDIVGVDVNMGCPKHFSTHGMMGSALLHNPSLAREV